MSEYSEYLKERPEIQNLISDFVTSLVVRTFRCFLPFFRMLCWLFWGVLAYGVCGHPTCVFSAFLAILP